MDDQYIRVGSLVASHGTEGELILKHNLGKKSAFEGVDSFFIEINRNSYLPYFPQQVRIKKPDEVILRLEGIINKEVAQQLLKKSVWLPASVVNSLAAKNAPVALLGYTVQQENETLGEVLEVIEQPLQILLRIEIQKKEVLIPLNESTLKKIDHKKRSIIVELPEGLLDVYLGS